MKSLLSLLLLMVVSTLAFSQNKSKLYQSFKLKKKYENLSNMSVDSVAMIVKSLSINYEDKKLKSKDTLFFYSLNPQYNVYQDSMTLYYLMHVDKNIQAREEKFTKEEKPKFKNEYVNFGTIKEEMAVYKKNLKEHLKYEYRIQVPVSYETFDLLLDIEPEDTMFCSYYNNGRIRMFNCKYGETVFNLAFHKEILPEHFASVQIGVSDWMPRKTNYKKPIIPIKASLNNKTIWEKQTGLPYQIAIELGLTTPMKQSKVLYKMDKVKTIKLVNLQKKPTDELEERVTQVNYFFLKCDTCYLSYKDFQVEDGDIIKVYVNDKEGIEDTIRLVKKELPIINNKKETVVYIEAISEGSQDVCTANMGLGDNNFPMFLKRGRVCKLIIRKEDK